MLQEQLDEVQEQLEEVPEQLEEVQEQLEEVQEQEQLEEVQVQEQEHLEDWNLVDTDGNSRRNQELDDELGRNRHSLQKVLA